ncbi:MAG TPA: VOC family protein [Thermoanaerobaculia bacterium]|nr:VOC family protein [Thermoanaerobaculia bacterium]
MTLRLDHLVYAAPDLERAVEELEALLGVRAAPGGRHLEEGTRNALLALGPDSYLEILAPDPAQRPPDRRLWLGVEGLARPRLTAWAVKGSGLEALVDLARAAGVRLGGVQPGLRKRPDGTLLEWEFTDPHVVVAGGLIPFVIDWKSAAHPAAGAPPGLSLVALRAEHPNPAGVAALLRGLGLNLPVTKGQAPALIANLETPNGLVELR